MFPIPVVRRYIPLLPMVLVNGAEGIGTGWSTSIPNYNPRDIVANLRRLLAGEPLEPMHPWYKGFKGAIVHVPGKATYDSFGIITQARPLYAGHVRAGQCGAKCVLRMHKLRPT